jgi:tRNA pseudouridine38-40 synthase
LQKTYRKLTGNEINIAGSGRTDTGVHAYAQVGSAILEKIIIPENKLGIAMNSLLPEDIRIINAKYLDFQFNARFDAIDRKYIYRIAEKVSVFEKDITYEYKGPFSKEKLQEIAGCFLGVHDFTTFSKINEDIRNNNCIINESYWNISDNKCELHIRANHFLYGMVRSLVGVMLDYARGKRTKDEILHALESKDRTMASTFVPPTGLFLYNVKYSEEINNLLYH